MREAFLRRALARPDVPRKAGGQRLPDDFSSRRTRQTECSASVCSSAALGFFIASIHIHIEVGVFRFDRSILSFMYAPILLFAFSLAFVSITFAGKEPQAKS
jgi:hypothetical protein